MAQGNGLVQVACRYSVEETVQRLQAAFAEKGLQVFALIDHSGEAQKVGLKMRPTKVVIFGSPKGGRTAAVLMSFVATCKLLAIDPYKWFCDVLSRIADHPQQRLAELLPHRWLNEVKKA